MTAEELIAEFAAHDHAVAQLHKKTAPPQEKIAALKTWLKEKIKLIEAKK